MRTHLKRIFIVLTLVALVLSLIGCGGDSGSNSGQDGRLGFMGGNQGGNNNNDNNNGKNGGKNPLKIPTPNEDDGIAGEYFLYEFDSRDLKK